MKIEKGAMRFVNLLPSTCILWCCFLLGNIGDLPQDAQLRAYELIQTQDFEKIVSLGNSLLNLGLDYYQKNQQEYALAIFNYLATIFPQSSVIQHNIGYTLAELNLPHQAINAYHKSLEFNPDNQETHVCLATALLATNNYLDGFSEYEWRWKNTNNALTGAAYPLWLGQDLTNKTILLRSEGALGDVLQFVRYAREIKHRGARVIVCTHKTLIPLLSRCPYIDKLYSDGDVVPTADFQQSLMSLPYVLKTTFDTIPNTIPYLYADKDYLTFWQQELPNNTNFKIGLCWQADPHNDANRPRRAQRSIPLRCFDNLCAIAQTTMYSIQAIDGLEQLAGARIQRFAYPIDMHNGAFMDTAALMQSLDLIITVDTATAHLAGALGVPVWLILPHKADWRWSHQGTTTPWYPTMRIWRKTEPENWIPIISELKIALEDLIQKGKNEAVY